MASGPDSDGDDRTEAKLEMPSFFGRRKKQRDAEPTPPTPPEHDEGASAAAEPAPTQPLRVSDRARRVPPVPPPPASTRPASVEPDPAAPEPTAPVAPAAASSTTPAPTPPAAPPAPRRRPAAASAPAPARPAARTAPETPAAAGTPTTETHPGPEMSWTEETTVLTAPRPPADDVATDPDGSEGDGPRRSRRPRLPAGGVRLPAVPIRLAAALTGVVVALMGVGLAWLSLQGCALVRGVSSCGGIGLLALAVIVVAEIVVGAALLRAFRSATPLSTSILGVGLVAVVGLLLPYGSLSSPWMTLVLPLVTAPAFVVAQATADARVDLGD
ncbi:hypothetical protein [Nocardioides scoriae]|nr:hypothetical protein [Nocardioides scoriae]